MTFLNPYMLFALSAIVIPVLLHLFNLKKVRKVEFSTLMFLKEIQKSKLRKIKLKQLLLLFLRIFIIIFIVLAFSNPVIKGYNFSDPDFRKSGIILLDDSFSMNSRDEGGSYFNQAKKYMEKILGLYKSTDKVVIIPGSYIGIMDSKFPDALSPGIKDSFRNLKISGVPFHISGALKSADDEISNENFLQTEIFIISDFQKINFDNISGAKFDNLLKNSVYIYPVNTGNREAHNVSVENVTFKTKLFQKNKKINITARVKNFNNSSAVNKQINLYFDANKVSETAVDILPMETKDVDFSFRVNKTGSITGYVELLQNDFSDDEISEDNKYYFSIYIPDKFRVLLISDNYSGSEFIKTAIETAVNYEKDSLNNSYKRYDVSESSSITQDNKNFDVMFISGKKSFSEKESALIEEFLNEGKGIFIFPVKNIEVNSYNSLFTKLNSFRINGLIVPDEPASKNLKFEKIDFEHPLISGIFKNINLSVTSEFNVETPEIKSYFDIALNEKSYPVITLSNGKPYLAESVVKNGKIVLCAVSALNDMSSFPLKSLFAPVVIRGTEYLSNIGIEQNNNVTGKSNLIFIRGIKNISDLILPDKKIIPFKLNPGFSKENNFFNSVLLPYSSFTAENGKYSFRDSADKSLFSFVLNFDSLENNMQRTGKNDIIDYLKEIGMKNVKYISNPADINIEISQNRKGLELWKYCLVIALIFLVAEMVYSKRIEKS